MAEGDFTIDVRVVGLYAYFEDLKFPQFDETTTVSTIMREVAATTPGFRYRPGTRKASAKEAIGIIEYDFGPGSNSDIPNASMPTEGSRKLEERLTADPAAVLQFYREAIITDGDKTLRIRNQTEGQPSFAITAIGLDKDGKSLTESLPDGWHIEKYRLIWRLVELDIKPDVKDRLTIELAEGYIT